MSDYVCRCQCPCGCDATRENEKVKNTGCLACSRGNHDMHERPAPSVREGEK